MELQLILMTIIALMALMTGIGFIFNLLLSPIKKDIAKLEVKLDQLLAQQK